MHGWNLNPIAYAKQGLPQGSDTLKGQTNVHLIPTDSEAFKKANR
jgi:hypothetical protein